MLLSVIISVTRSLLEESALLILKHLIFMVQSVCNLSAYFCKVCKLSTDVIIDFILCRGKCRQYLHYLCAGLTEERFLSMMKSYKNKWICLDCKNGRELNTSTAEDLNSETDSGNSLSSDIESVEGTFDNQNGNLPSTENELNALRQELTQTVNSVEQLRTVYNEIALKIADFERQISAQETNINKVSEDVRDTNKTVYALGQKVRDNRLEIHGLDLGLLFTDNVKQNIVEVGKCFGVEFSVKDIDKVDVLNKKNLQRPILVVHFVSKEVRDMLIASRRKTVINANLPGCSDGTRIYINENLCSYLNHLSYQARQLARRKGFKFVWVREGKLFIKKDSDSTKRRITCKDDLNELEAD